MAPLPRPALCLVTDRSLCRGRELEQVVEAAVEGGCDMVQLREKDLPAGELLGIALMLRSITDGRSLLIVNGRLDVALAAEADGVQLPEDGLAVGAARRVGGRVLIGRSVHDVWGGAVAASAGADFLVAGSVFNTQSHPEAMFATTSHPEAATPKGLGLISGLAESVSVPVIGIGGIDGRNVEAVMRAGAAGVAVIRAITESQNPEVAARELKRRMARAWERSGRRSEVTA